MTALCTHQLHTRLEVFCLWLYWSLVGIFGLVCVSLALTTNPIAGRVAWGTYVFIGCAVSLALYQGNLIAQSLARAAQVLGQRQVPHALWTDWLRLLLEKTARHWCILMLACIVVLSTVGTPWRWLTGAALVSLAMALSMARTLSQRGLFPAALGWCISGGLVLGALVTSVTVGLGAAFDAFSRSPDGLQWLLIAAWPVMAIILHRRWATLVPRVSRRSSMATTVVWIGCQRQLKRYVPLSPSWLGRASVRRPSNGPVPQGFNFFIFLLIYVFNLRQLPEVWVAWGRTVDFWHPLGLLAMIAMCIPTLHCKDLHWRMLLAPGGLHRGNLGFHMVRSTVEFLFGLSIIMLLPVWGILHLFTGSPPLDVLKLIQSHALFPLQLVFAISVASCLRALPRPGWVYVGLLLASLLAGALAYLAYRAAWTVPPWFTAGPGYVATLLILTVASITVSNHLWTVQKLVGAETRWKRKTS